MSESINIPTPPERVEDSDDTEACAVRLRLISQAILRLKEARHNLRIAEAALAAAENNVDNVPGARATWLALLGSEGRGAP
jgi:hypothetical protein